MKASNICIHFVTFPLHLILLSTPITTSTQETTPPLFTAPVPVPNQSEHEVDIEKDPFNYLLEVSLQEAQLKFVLHLGIHECYFQEIPPKYTIFFKASVYYDDAGPNAEQIKYSVSYVNNETQLIEQESGALKSFEYVYESEVGGLYSICFENSRVSTKIMWLIVQYYKTYKWYKHIPGPEEADVSEGNIVVATFMTGLNRLEKKITAANDHVTRFRLMVGADHRMQRESLDFMTLWSILQCVIIFGTGLLQVYCLKRFFDKGDERKVIRRTVPTQPWSEEATAAQRNSYAI